MHVNIMACFFFFSINHSYFLLLFKIEAKADVMLLPSFGFVKYLLIQIFIYL